MNETDFSNDATAAEPTGRERHVFGWMLFPLSLFPFVALMTYDWRAVPALRTPPEPSSNWIGAVGDGFAYYGYQLFGLAIWVVPAICVVGGLCLVLGRRMRPGRRELWSSLFLLCAACLMQVAQRHAPGIAALLAGLNLANAGGALGYLLMTRLLSPLLSDFGASVLVIMLMLVSLVAGIGLRNLCGFFAAIGRWAMAKQERDAEQTGAQEADYGAPALDPAEDRRREEALAREEERRRRDAEKAAAKAAKIAAK
ncbi:MAG: DNA translocase FtsK 4TM domain-containing protein, partial [Kiritimatiellae bacterium]|nr:DNA translocase FtsK 4TM domain-containing protein [Kiritimatiellia bacterium]